MDILQELKSAIETRFPSINSGSFLSSARSRRKEPEIDPDVTLLYQRASEALSLFTNETLLDVDENNLDDAL